MNDLVREKGYVDMAVSKLMFEVIKSLNIILLIKAAINNHKERKKDSKFQLL